MRREHHIRDPTAPISDVESIISIETSELDIIRSDSITFDLYKPFMDPLTIAELKRKNEEDWKKECEDRRRVLGESNQDNSGNSAPTVARSQVPTLEPDITLIRHDPTQPAPLSFPSVLKLTAKHTKLIPLNFFTDKNLSYRRSTFFNDQNKTENETTDKLDFEGMEESVVLLRGVIESYCTSHAVYCIYCNALFDTFHAQFMHI
ncbi:hypothetical protein GGU11DRAFT_746605 [Lentinula aff. detonsa]|nr:hypothetical protein GGU11DRAFT_746605 [Lentinula aff. detonsa]